MQEWEDLLDGKSQPHFECSQQKVVEVGGGGSARLIRCSVLPACRSR